MTVVRPKKHLGQHFLTDPSVAERITSSLDSASCRNVLEIGPGKGILTKSLSNREGIRLIASEIDDESVIHLMEKFPQLDVRKEDFLEMNLKALFDGEEFCIIGNFPYNISSQILFKVLEERSHVSELVGMFQKEVARRICSEAGNKEYGILSVLTQAVYETKFLFTVGEGVFFPRPKVKSGVIRLKKKKESISDQDFHDLKRLVKLAFNQRRKQLRNSLAAILPKGFNHDILKQRPEQLTWSEFLNLLNLIRSHSQG